MSNPADLPPLPKNHLDHPEQWATGDDPATDKQKGFIKVLEGQHKDLIPKEGLDTENMGKSEASGVIDKLKNGKAVVAPETEEKARSANEPAEDSGTGMEGIEAADKVDEAQGKEAKEDGKGTEDEEETTTKKRKEPPTETSKPAEADSSTAAQENGHPPSTDADDEMSERPKGKANSNLKQTTLADSVSKGSEADDEKESSRIEKDDNERAQKKAKIENGSESQDDEEQTSKSETAQGTTSKAANGVKTNGDKANGDDEKAGAAGTNGATNGTSASAAQTAAAGAADDTIPGDGDHLDHPENWATGDEPATEKQKGYVAVLEKQKGVSAESKEQLGKSEASEKIDELQKL